MARKTSDDGRNPNGRSTVYLGKDGWWHGRVTMGTRDDGRPDRRHVRARTESEATTKVQNLERKRDSGQKVRVGKAWTLEKWLRHWLENVAKPSVRYKTLTYYQTAVEKYLVPKFGAHRLDRLEPEHVERLYQRLRDEGAKASTVQQVHRTLRTALNEAVRRERITKNPVLVVKAPKAPQTEIEPLTIKEAQRILATARERRNAARWALALSLGLRQGEALGLKWSDLDTESGTLTIRRALQRQTWQHGCTSSEPCQQKRAAECPRRHSGGLVIVEPKSKAGRRVVSLPPALLDALVEHDEKQDEERHHAGELWQEGGWIFTQPNGKPLDPRADHQEWKALLEAAGVREARLHDARHTAATMLLVLKVPPRVVMEIMGWSEMSMTSRYQHVPDELRQGIANQVDGLLWQSGNPNGSASI